MWLLAGMLFITIVSIATTSMFGVWAFPFNCILALYVGFHIPEWEDRYGTR